MACLITDECITCGSCLAVCPNGAVTEGEIICVIDPEMCTECVGSHPFPVCVELCPAKSIVKDPDRVETIGQLWAKWRSLDKRS